MNDDPIFFLIIDNCPGRYDELTRLLDERGHRWAITHDEASAAVLLRGADVLVLDHDMPGPDGRARARALARSTSTVPVIIASTTDVPMARETMASVLRDAGHAVTICPADHHACELEWLAWAMGAVAEGRAFARRPRA